ncbi:MAG: hypothetical protein DHS80DRAFT_33891 [Piptocephalis tieghemiana]|nr:MAG: hypothetical protein DHS80DRAFT_33891 [Piptocephalis tieghemiana]
MAFLRTAAQRSRFTLQLYLSVMGGAFLTVAAPTLFPCPATPEGYYAMEGPSDEKDDFDLGRRGRPMDSALAEKGDQAGAMTTMRTLGALVASTMTV